MNGVYSRPLISPRWDRLVGFIPGGAVCVILSFQFRIPRAHDVTHIPHNKKPRFARRRRNRHEQKTALRAAPTKPRFARRRKQKHTKKTALQPPQRRSPTKPSGTYTRQGRSMALRVVKGAQPYEGKLRRGAYSPPMTASEKEKRSESKPRCARGGRPPCPPSATLGKPKWTRGAEPPCPPSGCRSRRGGPKVKERRKRPPTNNTHNTTARERAKEKESNQEDAKKKRTRFAPPPIRYLPAPCGRGAPPRSPTRPLR